MPPVGGAPAPAGGGLNLKRLPPWAWGVAIAGGAVVGFVLLKPKPSSEEGGEEAADGEGAARAGSGGAGGAIPALPDDLLQGLGLTGHDGVSGASGDSGSSSGDSSASTSSSGDSGVYTLAPYSQSLRDALFGPTTMQGPRPTLDTGTTTLQTTTTAASLGLSPTPSSPGGKLIAA